MGSKSAIGIGNGICFKQVRDKGGGSYIDPLVRDSLVGVWIADQNTNESPTRNIIKNTIKDKGGDLELLNFAYKLNSGYGKYEVDFAFFDDITDCTIIGNKIINHSEVLFKAQYNYEIKRTDVESFNAKVENITKGYIGYTYRDNNGIEKSISFTPEIIKANNGIITLPKSYNTLENSTGILGGLYGYGVDEGATITQIPSFEGALVTDGVRDLIVSQKTVSEMLGGSNEYTVLSMIHHIDIPEGNKYSNVIRIKLNSWGVGNKITSSSNNKTGIYGYTVKDTSVTIINNILGDKNDYGIRNGTDTSNLAAKFSVIGWIGEDDIIRENSSVAWYWTVIAKAVLTTDEINQVIAYYNLDRPGEIVKPDVLYDVKRQGLSNDTPEADWYLKDFSGNGHDMTLYNFAKKLGSGIGKYEVDFNTWIPQSYVADSTYTSNKLHITNIKGGNAILYTKKGANAMKVKITGIQSFNLVYRYIAENDVWEALEVDRDGIYELPASTTTTKTYYTGFTVPYYTGDCDITIEQIPDYEGALVSDGIDDYGNVENLPILKDYTVAIERRWITSPVDKNQCLAFKGHTNDWGAFACEFSNAGQLRSYTFSPSYNILQSYNEKSLVYQSKYSYSGTPIVASASIDGSTLRLCLPRGGFPFYANVAIKMFLLFPYSLSEFLLERQLKKYKLGTLYPDMVEFRPIIKNNNQYRRIDFYIRSWDKKIYPGDYVPINSILRANIYLNNELDELQSFRINGVNVTFVKSSVDKTAYNIGNIPIAKSPQKIDITIDEYIRFEDIIQPYPAIVNLSQDGKSITWGDKLKVGSEVTFVNHTNLLPDLYTVSGGVQYNGTSISWNTSIRVEKSMVFVNPHSYKKANEPNCILAPQTLRIPNSSYKILGYIPDLTGKGNHGRLNNFAYTEESGANEDGSIRFDGTDDHIIIPTIKHGGKALLMKVNWRYKNNIAMAYDQRINWGGLGISISRDQLPLVAYKPYNKVTYIDGIKNESVLLQDLEGITHNITGIYDNLDLSDERDVCISRTSDASNSGFVDMSMYEFMLFPDVPNEEEIKELNEVMGIEGGYVESPNYYYDAYGKKNTDTDRNLIADQVSKDVANALEVKNVAYNSESGYTDDNGLLLDGVEDHAVNTVIPAVTDFTVIAKRQFLNNTLQNNETFCLKGDKLYPSGVGNAFVMEYYYGTSNYLLSFGGLTDLPLETSKISYITPTSYNGNNAIRGNGDDNVGLMIGKCGNVYWKGVFYKAMFYTKTIDQLSINMLKNLFERDELIDITNPIFKKKEL